MARVRHCKSKTRTYPAIDVTPRPSVVTRFIGLSQASLPPSMCVTCGHVCDLAAGEETVGQTADRVISHPIRERKIQLGAEVALITPTGRVGVAETVIACDRVCAGNSGNDALENLPAAHILVETPVGESLQVSAGLRRPVSESELDGAAQGALRRLS